MNIEVTNDDLLYLIGHLNAENFALKRALNQAMQPPPAVPAPDAPHSGIGGTDASP